MPAIHEPIEAGIIVALISKLIMNNPKLWECAGRSSSQPGPEPELEDNSSNTTSVNEAELVHVHHDDPWIHT